MPVGFLYQFRDFYARNLQIVNMQFVENCRNYNYFEEIFATLCSLWYNK